MSYVKLIPTDPENPLTRLIALNDKYKLHIKLKPKDKLIQVSLVDVSNDKPLIISKDFVKISRNFIERLRIKKSINQACKIIGSDNKVKLYQVIEEAMSQLREEYVKYFEEIREKRRREYEIIYKKYENQILKDPLTFSKRILDIQHEGDDTAKKILVLTTVTRFNRDRSLRPSIQLQSSPASGKSNLLKAIMMLIPEKWVLDFTRITAHAFEYLPEYLGTNDIDGKIIFITEFEGIDKAYIIRVIMTEHKVTLLTFLPDNKGKLRPKKIELKGAPIFLTTSTKIVLDDQWLSRVLTLPVDESEYQTEKVVNFIVNKYVEGYADNEEFRREFKEMIIAFKYFLENLEQYHTVLTKEAGYKLTNYLESLPDTTYKRRITEKVIIALVSSHALINQHNRRRNGNYLYVEPEDVESTIPLIDDIVKIQVRGYAPKQYKLINDILKCVGDGYETYKDVHKCVRDSGNSTSDRHLRRIIQELEQDGFVEIYKNEKPYKIKVIESKI